MEASFESTVRARAVAERERTAALSKETAARLAAAHEELDKRAVELAELRAKVANLEIALQTNRRIGTAIGIIMAHRVVAEDEAFALLRAVSQRTHRKLRDIAEEVVLTGKLTTAA